MSERRNGPLVPAATAGMEICRLSAIGALFAHAAPGLAFPFPAMAASLLAALLLSLLLKRLRRRRVVTLAVHALGVTTAAVLVLRSTETLPFAQAGGVAGMAAAVAGLAGVSDWMAFLVIILFTLLFWVRGERIGSREPSYRITVARFDVGIGFFFVVYLMRMGLGLADPRAVPLVAAYFLFAMVALYGARNLSRDTAFLAQRTMLTLLVPFVAGFVVLGGAGVLLYPYLTQAAGDLYGALRQSVAPLSPWLVALLRFLFGFGFSRAYGDTTASGGDAVGPPPEEAAGWARLIERILAWGFVAVLAALALALVAIVLWRVIRYLAARSGEDDGQIGVWELLRRLVLRLLLAVQWATKRFVGYFRERWTRPAGPSGEAAAGFRTLCAWGRRSGIPRLSSETGRAYGRRLAARFPAAADAAATIVHMAELEVYGLRPPSRDARRQLRRARNALANPRLYPKRLACRVGLGRTSGADDAAAANLLSTARTDSRRQPE